MRASRSLCRTAVILLIIGYVLFSISLFNESAILHSLGITGLCGGVLVMGRARRCPNCKKRGLGLHFFAKNAGYCEYCGKLIEYDDGKWG